jgi:hypothetical protein
MTYKNFLTILLGYKKILEDISKLYDIGFDFYEGKFRLIETVEKIVDASFESFYNEKGIDWINWFIYENEFGEKDWNKYNKTDELIYGAKDENGEPICYSFESLYNYIEKYHKLNNDKQ